LAQVIFYLLLLSIAERIGFDLGFLVAAGATVSLISAYAGWVFESRQLGLIALMAFSLLYGLIYILMRLEDLALLVAAPWPVSRLSPAVMYLPESWIGTASSRPWRRRAPLQTQCERPAKMAEFLLPKDSRVGPGKHWPAPADAGSVKTFRIYRWDPEVGGNRAGTLMTWRSTSAGRWCWTY